MKQEPTQKIKLQYIAEGYHQYGYPDETSTMEIDMSEIDLDEFLGRLEKFINICGFITKGKLVYEEE